MCLHTIIIPSSWNLEYFTFYCLRTKQNTSISKNPSRLNYRFVSFFVVDCDGILGFSINTFKLYLWWWWCKFIWLSAQIFVMYICMCGILEKGNNIHVDRRHRSIRPRGIQVPKWTWLAHCYDFNLRCLCDHSSNILINQLSIPLI